MRKSIIAAISCVVAVVVFGQTPTTYADCGKMPVIAYQWAIPVQMLQEQTPLPFVVVDPALARQKQVSKSLVGEKNSDAKIKQIQKAGRDVNNVTVVGNNNNVTFNVYPGKEVECKPGDVTVPLPDCLPSCPLPKVTGTSGVIGNGGETNSTTQTGGNGLGAGSLIKVNGDWVTTIDQDNYKKTNELINSGQMQDSGIKDVLDSVANAIEEGDVDHTVAYGDNAFAEPEQQGLIAWNGTEESLILSTNEESLMGASGAMLSVLPLPGAPISIERANLDAFVTAKACVQKKIAEKKSVGEVQEYGVVYDTKIGAHNIFVWKIESGEDFAKGVQGYVASKYDSKAAALITPNTLKTVQWYCDKGYKYFAFDLTLVEAGQTATKEAISYNFKAPNVYFPLVISKVGGSETPTTVDLIVLSKGSLNLAMKKSVQEQVKVLGDKDGTVVFSSEELKQIDDNVAKRFEGVTEVKGREFIIRGTLDQFDDDFLAVSAK